MTKISFTRHGLIFAMIVIGMGFFGIYSWRKPSTKPENYPTDSKVITFLPIVKGCAETDKNQVTKSFSNRVEQPPTIKVVDNQIIYSRKINHLCCRKVKLDKQIQNSTINIYEIWSGIGCKCICFSDIKATLGNVPKGTYKVNVYEKGTEPGDSNTPMNQKLIISQQISIE